MALFEVALNDTEGSVASDSASGTEYTSRNVSVCERLLRGHFKGIGSPADLARSVELVEAREVFYDAGQASAHVYIICDGWASRFVRLRDGRRQILSFLIPGDLVDASRIFDNQMEFSLQAITSVRVCRIMREDVEQQLFSDRQFFEDWIARCNDNLREATATIVALGQFSAEERIAQLVLSLRERLEARGMLSDAAFPFPLRQTHIADATGVTSVHVSRILCGWRESGIAVVEGGMIEILNLARLGRMAGR